MDSVGATGKVSALFFVFSHISMKDGRGGATANGPVSFQMPYAGGDGTIPSPTVQGLPKPIPGSVSIANGFLIFQIAVALKPQNNVPYPVSVTDGKPC